MSLFGYQMTSGAQPANLLDIVFVHSGNPTDGMLEVHVGAPISAERAADGWLWLEKLYDRAEPNENSSADRAPSPKPSAPSTFQDIAEPRVDVELLPDEGDEQQGHSGA